MTEKSFTVHGAGITLVGETYPNVRIVRSKYMADESVPALVGYTEEGEPLAAFSVYLEGQPPASGCVWLKTWSEGEGAPDELVRLGLVELTGRTAQAGWSTAVEAKLLGVLA